MRPLVHASEPDSASEHSHIHTYTARVRGPLLPRREHLAASVLLEELQSQAHSIQLPPPSTAPSAPPRLTPLPQLHA